MKGAKGFVISTKFPAVILWCLAAKKQRLCQSLGHSADKLSHY